MTVYHFPAVVDRATGETPVQHPAVEVAPPRTVRGVVGDVGQFAMTCAVHRRARIITVRPVDGKGDSLVVDGAEQFAEGELLHLAGGTAGGGDVCPGPVQVVDGIRAQ